MTSDADKELSESTKELLESAKDLPQLTTQTHTNASGADQSLTLDTLSNALNKFKDQQNEFSAVIGFTFSPSAWFVVRSKLQKKDAIPGEVLLQGIRVTVVNGQCQACIGWFNKKIMEAYIEANGDLDVVKWLEENPEENV